MPAGSLSTTIGRTMFPPNETMPILDRHINDKRIAGMYLRLALVCMKDIAHLPFHINKRSTVADADQPVALMQHRIAFVFFHGPKGESDVAKPTA